MHPVGEQRIVNLPHPHPGSLLDTLNSSFGCEAAVNRFVYAPPPALVVSEHLVHIEDFTMFAFDAEFSFGRHPLNLLAHFVERGIDAVAFRFGVFRDGMFNRNARLVEYGVALRHPFHKLKARDRLRICGDDLVAALLGVVDQPCVGDQLRKHHCDGL